MVVVGSVYQSQAMGGSEYLDHGFSAVDITIVIVIDVEHVAIMPITPAIDTCTSIDAWTQYRIIATLNGFAAREMEGGDQGIDGAGHALFGNNLLKRRHGNGCKRADYRQSHQRFM